MKLTSRPDCSFFLVDTTGGHQSEELLFWYRIRIAHDFDLEHNRLGVYGLDGWLVLFRMVEKTRVSD